MESEDEEDLNRLCMIADNDRNVAARQLRERLSSLRTCFNMMKQHGNSLQHHITCFRPELKDNEEQFTDYITNLSDRAILFGISSRAMLKICSKYLESAELDSHRVFKMLQIERERTRKLEEMLYDTAKQHTTLERKSRGVMHKSIAIANKSQSFTMSEDEENVDSANVETEKDTEPEPPEVSLADSLHVMRRSVWLQSKRKSKPARSKHSSTPAPQFHVQNIIVPQHAEPRKSTIHRRSRVPDRPNISLNAWSVLKNSIGKDLSKIPIPVNFNEPLSSLQKLTEEMEYSELLDTAVNIEDKCEQMAYIAAFVVSAYSPYANRTFKPFNPLLYETYECDRIADRGWRSIAEQVSHHPPVSAVYCEGRGWTCWQECSLKTKFKGKNLQIIPTGHVYCKFEQSGNTYQWNKVVTTLNNIIVGKLWLDVSGDIEIKGLNAAADITCELTFTPYSIFSRETQRRVKGLIKNEKNETKFVVQGYWDQLIEIAPLAADKNEPEQEAFRTIWKRNMPEPGSEKYHHFSKFACELNELEEGVAPTDSRLRPDLRLMEQGLWDESNVEKLRLEEKQRQKRSKSHDHQDTDKEKDKEYIEPHEPIWFTRSFSSGKVVHNYNKNYWEAKQKKDWSRCPDIF